MHRKFEELRAKESGFTLVELLIVIVILGVLAAIVVFSVRGINNSSTTSACSADVATVNSALEAYYAQNKAYPASLQVLFSASNPLLKSSPTFGGNAATYSATTGTLSVTC
ncbi:MAG: prepilin-type N-terminal cleavage/methylation domain-containing protein [Actinomycetes bacterium]